MRGIGKRGFSLVYFRARLLSGWGGSWSGFMVSYLASSAYWITENSEETG